MNENEKVQKLKFQFDVGELIHSLDWVLAHADINRVDNLCLTYAPLVKPHPDDYYYQGAGSLKYEYYATPSGVKTRPRDPEIKETDFTKFIDKVKHTYFYEVYKQLNTQFEIGRMRIVKIHALHCLTWHRDPGRRIHVPLVTNPGNKLVIEDTVHFLPADGSAYLIDTTKFHSAFNGGKEHRYNLLCSVLDDLK